MESLKNNRPVNDPALATINREEWEALPKQPLNKLQFEEAVQRLQEAHNNHLKPASGTFY